jgi:hypothetical protein
MPSRDDNSPGTGTDSSPRFPAAVFPPSIGISTNPAHLPGAWTPVPAPAAPAAYDRWAESLPTVDDLGHDIPSVVVILEAVPPLERLAAHLPTVDVSALPPGPLPIGWADTAIVAPDHLTENRE